MWGELSGLLPTLRCVQRQGAHGQVGKLQLSHLALAHLPTKGEGTKRLQHPSTCSVFKVSV